MCGFDNGTTSCGDNCSVDKMCDLVMSGVEFIFHSIGAGEVVITMDVHCSTTVCTRVRHDIKGFEA